MKILSNLNFENSNESQVKIEEKNRTPGREILPETSSSLAGKYSNMKLDEFGKTDIVLKIYSHILGETIYFASNEVAIQKCGTIAGSVYSALELRRLIQNKVSQSGLKAINESKKVFRGSVIK